MSRYNKKKIKNFEMNMPFIRNVIQNEYAMYISFMDLPLIKYTFLLHSMK